MIIKRINDAAKVSAPAKNWVTLVHERVEANIHGLEDDDPSSDDKEEVIDPILEGDFSPGQLKLQQRVAFAQSQHKKVSLSQLAADVN